MRLELVQDSIKSELHVELGIKNYLETFNRDIPLIPHTILVPLSKEQGVAHFKKLGELLDLHDAGEISIDQLISRGRLLPQLDSLIPFLQKKELEQFHLHQLYQFLKVERDLIAREGKHHPLLSNTGTIDLLLGILEKYADGEATSLKLSPVEKSLRQEIHTVDDTFNHVLKDYEKKVSKEINHRMIYPYPKSFESETDVVKKASKSSELKVTKEGTHYTIDYKLTPVLQEIEKKREELTTLFKQTIDVKLREINYEISAYTEVFLRIYHARKDRLLKYTICLTALDNKLCLPVFTQTTEIELKDGILPILKENRKDKYIPLNILLDSGANIIYGSNMSGKTTILKTLYFILQCVRFGLPIPAKSIKLKYPTTINILLKSSGSLDQNISSFGQELEFYSQDFEDSSYIFSDELFQSTSPESGATLCDITLKIMGQKDLVFLASTHYPSILQNKEISLYKMKDLEFDREIDRELTVKDLIGRMPFEVLKITENNLEHTILNGKTPLKIAMHFPLSEEFKREIKKKLH